MTRTLVGINGYARSGKDSAAKALTGRGWTQRSYAKALKDFVYAQNPWLPPLTADGGWMRLRNYVDAVGWERAKDEHPEVRPLLQRTGTEAGRRVLHDDVWVDAALRCLSKDPRVVLADCRFPNEADAIRERGGVLLRIERPGVGPATNDAGEAHTSETALDGWSFDAVIVNDGTLAQLEALVLGNLTVLGMRTGG